MSRKRVAEAKRPRRSLTEEFKREAVAMLMDGLSSMSVPERLGLSNPNLLYRWKSSQLEQSGAACQTRQAKHTAERDVPRRRMFVLLLLTHALRSSNRG